MNISTIGWYKGRGHRRRASAVVEMAVVSPLLLMMIFGVIEFGTSFMVRQILTNAAREGARVAAIQPVADDAAIRIAVRNGMSSISGIPLAAGDIEITHWCKHGGPGGTPNFTETVRVTLDYGNVAIFGTFFGIWDDLVAVSSMRKEGVTQDSTPPGSGLCSS